METESKKLLPDHLMWAKFSSLVCFLKDGFFYSRYEKPKDDELLKAKNEFHNYIIIN